MKYTIYVTVHFTDWTSTIFKYKVDKIDKIATVRKALNDLEKEYTKSFDRIDINIEIN